MWQVAEALKFLHTQQFIHGDIKPENILIDSDGRLVFQTLER